MAGTLGEHVLRHYVREPERPFVRCVHPGGVSEIVSYRRLVERGSQISKAADDVGSPRGSFVVIILPHSVDLYCSFFGAIVGGRVPSILAVPSFKLNALYYRRELEALLSHIRASVLITDTPTASHLGLDGDWLHDIPVVIADRLAPAPVSVQEAGSSPDEVALLQHSSGSTGLKKGVALSHRAVLHQIEAYRPTLDLRPDDRMASWLPLYHDMGLIACAVMPAVLGVPVTALNPLHWVTNPGSLLRAIHDDRCTLAWMPNFAYEFLARQVRDSQLEGVSLASMRGWINCSEPTVAESHRRFWRRYADWGVRPETLWTCYAAAETTFAIAQSSDKVPPRVERVDRARFLERQEAVLVEESADAWFETMSAGVPLHGTEIRILDGEGRDLPARRVGEIAIRSQSLFSGYFRQPESTSSALRDGWYHSGDLGYQAEGHLFVTGRHKDLIIIAGRNYYPQDIERIVSDVEGIYDGRVVALGLDDPAIGTQRLIVLAEVVEPRLADSSELRARIREAVSARLECAIDDLRLLPHMWLLKTSSGKIARTPNLERYLRDLAPVGR